MAAEPRAELLDAVRSISERVVIALEEYAQAKDPRVLDNLIFLTERVYRLILSIDNDTIDTILDSEMHETGEAGSLLATAIAILQVSSC